MEYVLVSDDCHECCYVLNALSFLALPYKKLSLKELTSPTVSNAIATFVCHNINTQHAQTICDMVASTKKKIISWGSIDTLHASLHSAIHALKMPFNQHEFSRALSLFENTAVADAALQTDAFEKFVGNSEKIRAIKSVITQVSQSDTTVLILGQSGTGKDVVASCLHQLSQRKNKQFVPINCGAIPSELIESELFGHEKGAFTGAAARRAGRFEMAKGGTLFLDEIGDMPLHMQVKLLRVIQDRKIERVGGNTTIDIDVRLIAATNKNLEQLVTRHKFREDLYYRLNVFPIELPTLAERCDDIPFIIEYHLNRIQERLKHRVVFTEHAMQTLQAYPWPGNIRELQNFLERMVILYPDHVIDVDKLCLNGKH